MKIRQKSVRVLITGAAPLDCQLLVSAMVRFRQPLEIVATAVSKQEILQSFDRADIDVALINADLEDGSLAGLYLIPELTAGYPETPLVVLFNAPQNDLIVQAFRAGAKGVLFRSEKIVDMVCKCICAVHNGQVWANSEQLQVLLKALSTTTPIRAGSSSRTNLLAAREGDVASLVAEGLPTKAIALRLGLTEHTVSNYLFRIYNKVGVSNRVELVLWVSEQTKRGQVTGRNLENGRVTTLTREGVLDLPGARVQGSQPKRSDSLCARRPGVAKSGSLGR